MAIPSSPGSDFLLSKTDEELLYLAQNPNFYHPDLVAQARQELRRRGVAPPLAEAPTQAYVEHQETPTRRWLAPALGVGLLLLAAVIYSWPTGNKNWKNKRGPVKPRELMAVPTRVLPSFDSLTRAQLRQMPAALPAAEQADTTARRKYLLLARRYWEAENQSVYLLGEVQATRVDAAFPGQVDITLDKWKRLTSALVYDHKLRPAMTEQVELMRRGALVRHETLTTMKGRYQYGQPPLDQGLLYFHDSAQVIGQTLLGVPAPNRIRPQQELQKRVDADNARQHIRELPQV